VATASNSDILQSLKSWKTYHDYMKKVFLESASVLSTGIVLLLLSTIEASAQPLVMNTPTNIAINPEEPLPANGTVSISTEGATDTDMNVIPPEGVSVIISNDTVTVTNQIVDFETADEDDDETEEADTAEDEDGSEEEGTFG
jgi:hypothetical protein